jgi:hypothetical protein
MKRIEFAISATLTLLFCLFRPISATSETQKINGDPSKITIHIYKSGFFSVSAHDHEIESPVAGRHLDCARKAGIASEGTTNCRRCDFEWRASPGSAYLKQSDAGITVVRVAGRTVEVRDEVKVEVEVTIKKCLSRV